MLSVLYEWGLIPKVWGFTKNFGANMGMFAAADYTMDAITHGSERQALMQQKQQDQMDRIEQNQQMMQQQMMQQQMMQNQTNVSDDENNSSVLPWAVGAGVLGAGVLGGAGVSYFNRRRGFNPR